MATETFKTFMDSAELEAAGARNMNGNPVLLGQGEVAYYVYDDRNRQVKVAGMWKTALIYKLAKTQPTPADMRDQMAEQFAKFPLTPGVIG